MLYLNYMKTAISIPDNVYKSAEELARRLGESRSEFYTKAIKSYVEKQKGDKVIEKLNEVYKDDSSKLDVVLNNFQIQSWAKNNPW